MKWLLFVLCFGAGAATDATYNFLTTEEYLEIGALPPGAAAELNCTLLAGCTFFVLKSEVDAHTEIMDALGQNPEPQADKPKSSL
jgi:hypothetical protein